MVRQDILGGMKNAIEHGSSIEQAKQSFLNAGYSPEEVDEAARYVNVKDFRIVSPPAKELPRARPLVDSQSVKEIAQRIQSSPTQTQMQSQTPSQTQTQEPKEKNKSSAFLWILVVILFLLVIGGGIAMYFLGVFDMFFPPATPDALPLP